MDKDVKRTSAGNRDTRKGVIDPLNTIILNIRSKIQNKVTAPIFSLLEEISEKIIGHKIPSIAEETINTYLHVEGDTWSANHPPRKVRGTVTRPHTVLIANA